MRLSDTHGPSKGIFRLNVFVRGELVEKFEEDNLLVDQGRANVVHLLGGDGANLQITQIGFGTSGVAPAAGNTALTGQFLKALTSHSYPTATSVQFNFDLATTDANGLMIMEFGLITASGTLHARKVRAAALAKASDMSLSGSWTLLY